MPKIAHCVNEILETSSKQIFIFFVTLVRIKFRIGSDFQASLQDEVARE